MHTAIDYTAHLHVGKKGGDLHNQEKMQGTMEFVFW